MNILYHQTFSASSTIAVTHNLGLEYIDVSIVVNGQRRGDLILSVVPDIINPTNISIVTLTSSQSGTVQVFSKDIIDGNQESSTMTAHAINISEQQVMTQLAGMDAVQSEHMLFTRDVTRLSKHLSVETTPLFFGRTAVNSNAWLKTTKTSNNISGYIMPYNGTIIRASLLTTNNNGQARSFSIYINTIETTGVLSTTGLGVQSVGNTAIDIDFAAGDLLRFRGRGPGGLIQDTTATVLVKWRI